MIYQIEILTVLNYANSGINRFSYAERLIIISQTKKLNLASYLFENHFINFIKLK